MAAGVVFLGLGAALSWMLTQSGWHWIGGAVMGLTVGIAGINIGPGLVAPVLSRSLFGAEKACSSSRRLPSGS